MYSQFCAWAAVSLPAEPGRTPSDFSNEAGLCSSPGVGAVVPGRGFSSFVGSSYLCVPLRRTAGQGPPVAAGFSWTSDPLPSFSNSSRELASQGLSLHV